MSNLELNMNNQYSSDMYDYPPDRSHHAVRPYGSGVERQTSRYVDNSNYGGSQQALYATDEHHPHRYDPALQEFRGPPSTIHGGHYAPTQGYESHTWNNGTGVSTIGGVARGKQNPRRGAIPTHWEQPIPSTPLPPFPMTGAGEVMYQPPQNTHINRFSPASEGSEDLIPTAIVIKNIPFAIRKEQLQEQMQAMGLPLPYAFNYHFDAGVFRGLAFANFTNSDETGRVIKAMNGLDLNGRKLRVEYKKMLPLAERDRIERDKRERRGQLQEQHQPVNNGQLHNQGSMTSLGSNIPATSPSPASQRSGKLDIDLNEPTTLRYYTDLTLFQNDTSREALIFPPGVTPLERRTIHTLAHHMGLEHRSEGSGENRQVQILKTRPPNANPVTQLNPTGFYNETRRGLNRAATVDFTENRALDSNYNDFSIRRQGSFRLGVPSPPGTGLSAAHNLRGAKSFGDMRSFSPSPVPSTSSFPTSLAQNVNRYAENYHNTNASGTPNLTPTSAGGMNSRDDLANGMASLGIRDTSVRSNYTSSAGPIGSQRPINGSHEEAPRNGASGVPQRQPKGPSLRDWESQGFTRPRQNGHINRGSDSSDRSAPSRQW